MAIRVLVVDDEPDMRLLLGVRFRRMGWEVDAVESGEEAVTQVQDRPYDVAVLDQKMTGMSGLETSRALRDAGFEAPILLFSAYLDPALEAEAARMGVTTMAKVEVSGLDDRIESLVQEVDSPPSG
jgi:CheY-like chemotaxis protein